MFFVVLIYYKIIINLLCNYETIGFKIINKLNLHDSVLLKSGIYP